MGHKHCYTRRCLGLHHFLAAAAGFLAALVVCSPGSCPYSNSKSQLEFPVKAMHLMHGSTRPAHAAFYAPTILGANCSNSKTGVPGRQPSPGGVQFLSKATVLLPWHIGHKSSNAEHMASRLA